MRNTFLAVLLTSFVFAFNSCAPVYKCGDEKPERGIMGSNRILDVVKERDDLCAEVKTKEEELVYFMEKNQTLQVENDSLLAKNQKLQSEYNTMKSELEGELADLQKQHTDLQEKHMDLGTKYSTAITEKLNQGHLYDERLKEKERRMELKEQELADQEAILNHQMNMLAEREQQIQELEGKIARQDSIAKRLNQLLKEALLGFDGDELTTEIKNGKVYVSMSDKLMFQSGKATVQAKGKEALASLATVLKKNTEFQILVEGHTDNVPIKTNRYKDNWDLSVDRATEIVRLLQEDYKIDPLRLTASGRGEFLPRESNDTANGRAKNRRTEIILSPNLTELMDLIKN